jgi:hypothetical protein
LSTEQFKFVLCRMQMNRTEAAVKRTTPAGYHGYCSTLRAIFSSLQNNLVCAL